MQKTVLLKLGSFFILCFFSSNLKLEVKPANQQKVEKKNSTTAQSTESEKKDNSKIEPISSAEVKPEVKKDLEKNKASQEESSEDDEDILSGKVIFKPMIDEAAKKYGFRGNWVEKKILLMKAAGYLSEISQTNKEIIEARKNLYAAKIDEVSVLLKSFRLISGSKKEDDLATAISNLQDKTDAKLNEILDLGKEADQKNFSQEIRFKLYEAEEKYAINKEKLSKLKMDVDFVDDLQKSFDNRVAQLDKGIEQAGNILNQAEEIVDQISRMADHKMAEEKCFVTENLLKNIRIIKNFVKVEAIKQFDSEQNALSKEVSRLKSEMSAISTEIEKLDKEMLDVQKNISSLPPKNDAEPKKENKVAISEAANEVSKSTEQTSKINLPKKEPLKKGFFGEFIEWFKDFWLFLKSLIGV